MPSSHRTELPRPPAEVRELLYFAESEGGLDADTVRFLGQTEVGVAVLGAWRTAHFGGQLPHRLKELVRLRLSTLDPNCSPRARAEGVTDDVLAALPSYLSSPLFTNQEKVALQYAEWFEDDDVNRDDVFKVLRTEFSDEEIIELGKFCAQILGIERFLASLSDRRPTSSPPTGS